MRERKKRNTQKEGERRREGGEERWNRRIRERWRVEGRKDREEEEKGTRGTHRGEKRDGEGGRLKMERKGEGESGRE